MIVRETSDHYVMIEQHKHALLSRKLMGNWKDEDLHQSVLIAIELHDYGWKFFDKQPLWNDRADAPYHFTDFPLAPKISVYTHGINEVEKIDSYAALLCSEHYSNFLLQESSPYASYFVDQEKKRQKRIIQTIDNFDKDVFQFHYELLKFADSLSLFLCINPPGAAKEELHFFFQHGIRLPSLDKTDNQVIFPHWKDDNTVLLNQFPFKSEMDIQIEQKVIPKKDVKEKGMIKSYEDAPYELLKIVVSSK